MNDMAMPPDYPTIPQGVYDEVKLVKLARQIAMGISDLPDILFSHGLTLREFDEIKQLPAFNRMLTSEITAWEGAANTPARLRLKTAAMLEEYLPELYARLNDRTEPLMGKVKALELTAKLAGFGERVEGTATAPGDRVQVIINLGADTRAEYVKVLPPKVIDNSPEPVTTKSFEDSFEAAFEESLNDRAD